MNNFLEDFKYISRFGVYYMFDLLLVKFGFKKKQSHKALIMRQKFYQSMDRNEYKDELLNWYHKTTGRTLNIDNPKTFTEKIQWLKLYDSNELKTLCADKFLVRKWVEKRLGESVLIPLLGVWDNADDIDFDDLPNRFVLKCNHGCAMNIIVSDKNSCNIKKITKKLNEWLEINYAFVTGDFQLHYGNIKPKIIAEEYLQENGLNDLKDYKFFCFDGIPRYCQVITERSSVETIDFFDMNWVHMPFVGLAKCANSDKCIKKPITFSEMIIAAEKLANGFKFVRVDFYEVNNKLYFGEMTFTPGGGAGKFEPEEYNYLLGDMIKL